MIQRRRITNTATLADAKPVARPVMVTGTVLRSMPPPPPMCPECKCGGEPMYLGFGWCAACKAIQDSRHAPAAK